MSSPPVLLLGVAAGGGVLAFWLTRRFGRVAAFALWGALLVASFVVVRPIYARATHCESLFTPAWAAFTAASGTWAGIHCAGAPPGTHSPSGVALMAALLSLVPGVFLVLLMWPCG